MATAAVTTWMSVEEYLRTTFRPDVDYVDGFIEERNLGEFDHVLSTDNPASHPWRNPETAFEMMQRRS